MMYLLYILIGLLIVLGVNLAITAFWAVHDMYVHRDREDQDLITFKKYFVKSLKRNRFGAGFRIYITGANRDLS